MKDYVVKAKQIIEKNIYCAIATASKDGKPWISPVFFAYDIDYNIYWVSNKNAKHSRIIKNNPQVAIVVFNPCVEEGAGDGVYIEAIAYELSNKSEVTNAMGVMNRRIIVETFRIKQINQVTGDGIWRIYKAVPKEVTKLTEGEYIKGQYVDTRVKVDLKTD